MKADADLLGGGDLVIDAAAIREDIGVVEDRRAPGRRQFGEPHERRPAGRLRRTAGPDPVVGSEPGKQVIVLRGRQVARERLVEVVVDVHKAGQDDLPGQIKHLVGSSREVGRVGPTCSMIPSLANRPAFVNSRRSPSIVTNTSAFLARSVGTVVQLR